MTEAQIRQLVAEETRNSYTQFLQYMEQYRQDLCKLPSPEWAAISGELDQAIALGITDGSRPQDSVTRAEAAAMVMRALKVLKGD